MLSAMTNVVIDKIGRQAPKFSCPLHLRLIVAGEDYGYLEFNSLTIHPRFFLA